VVRFVVVAGFLTGCSGGGTVAPDAPSVPTDAPAADSGLLHVDRAHLADVGTAGRLDYGDPALWLCRPDSDGDACAANLDATELRPDGGREVVAHVRAPAPAFDCFYVYPTVYFDGGNQTNLSDVSAQLDPLLSQAARFTRICNVYAPLYRQVSLTFSGGFSGDAALAQKDGRDAFRYYLDHLNHGRRFVLLGHSQGTAVLTQVIQSDVESQPDVRARLISAVLIGGDVRVADPAGVTVPQCATPFATDCVSFTSLPLCAVLGDTGCVIAYSSYRAEAPPAPASGAFGRHGVNSKVACVNPRLLAKNLGRNRGGYLPLHYENPLFTPTNAPLPAGVTTPFALERDLFQADCVERTIDGISFSYLEIGLSRNAGDVRPDPPYYSAAQEAFGFGLHVADYNLALDDLIDAVAAQAATMR
jgi:hypothetical protein